MKTAFRRNASGQRCCSTPGCWQPWPCATHATVMLGSHPVFEPYKSKFSQRVDETCAGCGFHVCCCDERKVEAAIKRLEEQNARYVAMEPKQQPAVRVGWHEVPLDRWRVRAYERDDKRAAVYETHTDSWMAGKRSGDGEGQYVGVAWSCGSYAGPRGGGAEAAMAWADAKLGEEDAAAKPEPKPAQFSAGQRVRCVDATGLQKIRLGEELDVEGVEKGGVLHFRGLASGYTADRFEPIDDREERLDDAERMYGEPVRLWIGDES